MTPTKSGAAGSRALSSKPLWAQAFKKRREKVVGSQEEMAMRADISQSLISQIERGVQSPTGLSVERFARVLDTLQWTASEFAEATGLEIGGVEITAPSLTELLNLQPMSLQIHQQEKQIPETLLEAANLYGELEAFSDLKRPQWQIFLANLPREVTPNTAQAWCQEYLQLKALGYGPRESK